MTWEIYTLYLALIAAFFATPPDTSQLLIMTNSIQHGMKRSVLTIFGDLSANALQMTAAAFGLAAIIATSAAVIADWTRLCNRASRCKCSKNEWRALKTDSPCPFSPLVNHERKPQ